MSFSSLHARYACACQSALDPGFTFVEFIDMQKSLRKVCEAQIELKDELKATKRELDKVT